MRHDVIRIVAPRAFIAGRPARLHCKAELSGPQTGSAVRGTHPKTLPRDDGSQHQTEAIRLARDQPVWKAVFDPLDIALRFGRDFGFEVRFLLGSRRLNSIGARLYLRLGKLAPGAQGNPRATNFKSVMNVSPAVDAF